MTAPQDDATVQGKDALQACQPSQLNCTIQIAKDEQPRYLLDCTQALFQISQVIMTFRGALEQVMRVATYRLCSFVLSGVRENQRLAS